MGDEKLDRAVWRVKERRLKESECTKVPLRIRDEKNQEFLPNNRSERRGRSGE